jgi:hypothetical protein
LSRSDEERVADIIEAAEELAAVTSVGRDAFLSSRLRTSQFVGGIRR